VEDTRKNSSRTASSTRSQMSKSQLSSQQPEVAPKKLNTTVILVVVLCIAVVTSLFFYSKYQKSQDQLKNPQTAAQAQTQDLVDQVGKLTDLPQGKPTVATVSDVSKLSSQSFFVNAKNGDKVLIYSDAKKAILYRPSQDKVINIAPLDISDTKPQ